MAKKQDTAQNQTNTFIKGLNKDSDPSFVTEGMWTHARNAVNNTAEGDLGTLSNERSNALCAKVGETMIGYKYIIGLINLFSDYWIVYTAAHLNKRSKNSANSEIGLFVESSCDYFPIVIDDCLNFSRYSLISGASREKEDCSWQVYWADGRNPDRFLNVGDPQTWPISGYVWGGVANVNKYFLLSDPSISIQWPNVQWQQDCSMSACQFCVDLPALDCDKIRLARLMETPCLELILGNSAGTLDNGSYFVAIAYTIKGIKVTDYFSPSNIQAVYTPNNSQGSLQVNVTADSENFDEFVLISVAFINEGVVAKQIGRYSTRTSTIFIDQIKLSAIDVDDFDIVKQTPVFEKSDQIAPLNNYLLRIGPTSKFDFNYQPLANLIETEWVAVEYPSDYYFKGGYKTTYMRDEVYTFFVRWVYDTGDKSSSYHIPGRPPTSNEISLYSDDNSLPNDTLLFETINTASQTSAATQTLPDGGVVIASGQMGYWQAETELYPDNRPDLWNSSYHPWTNKFGIPSTDYDLCGLPLRHHLFPDNDLTQNTYHFRRSAVDNSMKIRLMAVRFKNIVTPVDNEGNIIRNIVGYEILRGSREGNRSIIAKGMLNNFKDYTIQGVTGNTRTGLYANYPYNCIIPPANQTTNPSDHNYNYNDPFIKKVDINYNVQNQNIPREIVSFHSPDTSFRNPFLSVSELKLYGNVSGTAQQQFIEPAGHPTNKLLTNVDFWLMMTYALGYALLQSGGKKTINYPQGSYTGEFDIEQTQSLILGVGPSGTLTTTNYVDNVNNAAGIAVNTNNQSTFYNALQSYYNQGFILDGIAATDTLDSIFKQSNDNALQNDATYNPMSYTLDLSGSAMLPSYLKILGGIQNFAFFFSQGLQTAQTFMYAIAPLRQYALQLIGHGYYDVFNPRTQGAQYRYRLEDGFYLINDTNQEIPDYIDTNTGVIQKYTIQNLLRPKLVVLRTSKANTGGTTGPSLLTTDLSSVTLGMADDLGLGPKLNETQKTIQFNTPIASHYASIKVRLKNQYGQLQSIKQQAITPCEQKTDAFGIKVGDFSSALLVTFYQPSVDTANTANPLIIPYNHKVITESNIFFGGDSYVCRFTEKNPMFMFYNWLYGVANDFEYNYFVNQMLPQARYWMNSQHYDVSNISIEQLSDFLNITNNAAPGQGLFPEDYYQLDNDCYRLSDDNQNPIGCNASGFISPKDHYFYTSISGVRDFFVETDVLVDFREVGTFDFEKCYHPYRYTDLQALFKMDPIIPTRGNYYIYDQSLSASRLPSKFLTFGILQNKYYDPLVSSLCYVYYPNVISYSLPYVQGSVADSWFIFLPNNRKDFIGQVSSVKNFARTGALVTFKNDGPQVFQGVDQLQMDASGVKVTVGDGGLFTREPQNLVVTDTPYQYGSSQSRLAVISTPAGIYYISQNQGKIFTYNEGITEISQSGMKWWFDEFLPSRLLEDFPQYDYADNPVAGIGCQAIYDNENAVLYFCKKDYRLRAGYNDNPATPNRIQYVSNDRFSYFVDTLSLFPQNKKYDIGDPEIFEDASWTVSYDPKNRFWISYHDWHPDLTLPTKSTIVTTKTDEFWSHNFACNDYCNFYDVQYPFEIEFPIVTGQSITTLKSVEYILECYKRDSYNCVDQFHVLDYNFDYAVIHNTEQVSAYLKLNIYAKNNPPLNLEYPKAALAILVDPNLPPYPGFDILFSKEENKYRFNQFWDSVFDRGEFPRNPPNLIPPYPPTNPVVPGTTILSGTYREENLWVTQSNGYVKTVNYNNINLAKSPLEHKKFRHYVNFIKLSKVNSRDTNMILKIFNTKNQYSPR